jgi:hypothetical protein
VASASSPVSRSRALWVAAAVAAVPFLVVAAMSLGSSYRPVGDAAFIDLRVRDVFSGDLPLVGVYSRYGWNHPGPVLLWALAPLNAIAGGAAWSTQLGTVLLQLGAVILAGWSAWRRGGPALVAGMACTLLLTLAALGPQVLRVPWNPYVALPALRL